MPYFRVGIHGTVIVEAETADEAVEMAQQSQSNWEEDEIAIISADDPHELDEGGDEIE